MADDNTFGQLLVQMRQALRPKGTADAVVLRLGNSTLQALVLTEKQVQAAIGEFEMLGLMHEQASPLQQIAIHVLMDSTYLTWSNT